MIEKAVMSTSDLLLDSFFFDFDVFSEVLLTLYLQSIESKGKPTRQKMVFPVNFRLKY